MAPLTKKESEVLLRLFKDFSRDYNANSISHNVGVTPRGALKILKNLEKEKLVIGKKFGKAVFYKPNLGDIYLSKTIETLLISESREKAARWLYEFKDIFKDAQIIIIFGSITKNPQHAQDIDVLFVFERKKYRKISSFVNERNLVLLKKIHFIPQTIEDFKINLKKNEAIKDALRTGYVLHGFDTVIEVVKDVAGF